MIFYFSYQMEVNWRKCAEEIALYILTGPINYRYRSEYNTTYDSLEELLVDYTDRLKTCYERNKTDIVAYYTIDLDDASFDNICTEFRHEFIDSIPNTREMQENEALPILDIIESELDQSFFCID